MIHQLAPNIWHAVHKFKIDGKDSSSRMTVVRLRSGDVWLHSPIPISKRMQSDIFELGPVRYVVAPNRYHHLYVSEALKAFPQSVLFGAPGLQAKRPDLIEMRVLQKSSEPEWSDDLDQVFVEGIPVLNETVWFHKPSATLILTDLCQWTDLDKPNQARMYEQLTCAREGLAASRTLKLVVKDRLAAKTSVQHILKWPFRRVILAHNDVIQLGARVQITSALAWFLR
jgi:Domain of unknown function (DUF4336)